MKEYLILLFLLFSTQDKIDTSKMYMIYFTRTGNTEIFANYIKEKININSFRINPVTPYTDNLTEMLEYARVERSNNMRPEINGTLPDISKYDTIFLGYPLWHSYLPNIMINLLEKMDFNGKTIYPFNTYGTKGVGESLSDIKTYAKGATIKDGFAISDSEIKIKENSQKKIDSWYNDNFNNTINEEPIDENEIGNILNFRSYFLCIIFILLA